MFVNPLSAAPASGHPSLKPTVRKDISQYLKNKSVVPDTYTRYIVKIKNNVKSPQAVFEKYSTDDKVKITRKVSDPFIKNKDSKLKDLTTNVYVVDVKDNFITDFKKDKNIDYIEKDTSSGMMDISAYTWNQEAITIPATHMSGATGAGVKIAVLDTGIDNQNTDLIISGGASFVDGVESYNDDNGHGTSVASVIESQLNLTGINGTAPDSSLYAIKVLDSNGMGWYSNIIDGINWSIDNGMNIICLSLGGRTYSTLLMDAVNRAEQNGILVVAASGNTGEKNSLMFPARFGSVLSVGAVDFSNKIASFSTGGAQLDLLAPGVNIMSAGLNNQYTLANGTSLSAILVILVVQLGLIYTLKEHKTENI
jgi:subtilisin family serine protease